MSASLSNEHVSCYALVDSLHRSSRLSFAGLVSPGDAILGTGDMLTDSTYWLQAKSAMILESQPRPVTPTKSVI